MRCAKKVRTTVSAPVMPALRSLRHSEWPRPAIMAARMSISGGKTIAEPLSKGEIFPKMVTHMISVGETTGALDAMLGKIADFYEDEVDQAVASLTSLLEPMMMVFLGTLIGFIVVAMYLPIFQMAAAIG